MLPETYLYVLINVIFSVNAVLGALQNLFVKQRTDDLTCGNSSTLTDLGTVGNVIACSRTCSSKSGCRGFYFNEDDGACWGSNQTECQTVTDTMFYLKEYNSDCGSPATITNAVISAGGNDAGDNRTYTCSPGYFLRNSVTMETTCQPDGTWSATSFECLWDCGAPPSVTNAVVSGGDTVATTTRAYTCNVGYAVNGTATLTCQTGATWSAVSFTCIPDCSEPPVIENATLSVGDTLEGTTRNYTCNTGLVVNGTGPMTTICQPNGTWSTVDIRCQPEPGCPAGWDQIGSSCYVVPDYPTTINASEIIAYCDTRFPDYDTYMVQLETQEEDVAVNVFLQTYLSSSSEFCIGLHDPLHNNVWVWMETNEPVAYSGWAGPEPNGAQQYYVEKTTLFSYNLGWRDIFSDHPCQPVCEISLL